MDMLAFGNSAIGDVCDRFAQNAIMVGGYEEAVAAGRLPVVKGMRLSDDDRLRRSVILHLMCNLELPWDLTVAGYGRRVEELIPGVMDGLADPHEEPESLGHRQVAVVAVIRDGHPFDQFHHEVRPASVGGSGVQDLGDMGVVQHREDLFGQGDSTFAAAGPDITVGSPHATLSTEIDHDIIETGHPVEQLSHVIMGFYLNGIGVP